MRFFPLISLISLQVYCQISGTILNGITQDPIEGALVRFQTRSTLAITDMNGNFSLEDEGPGKLVGAAYGYFNEATMIAASGSQTGITISLSPIDTLNTGAPFNSPDYCAICHDTLKSQYFESPMAKSGLNVWVFDILDGTATPGTGMNGFVYTRDSIHTTFSPNSDCAACHSPGNFLSNPNIGMGDFNNPSLDMQLGIQCEVCHKAYDLDETKTNWPGVIPPEDGGAMTLIHNYTPMEFGRLGDVDNQTGMRGSYNPQLASLICAACHEDNNDSDEDGDFEDSVNFEGAVPSETTYSEWLIYESQHGEDTRSCVDCHMPVTDLSSFCSLLPDLDRTGQVRNHTIRGTTPEFLENALDLDVAYNPGLNRLGVNIAITNLETGHSVPTGVTVRNVILLLLVRDQNGSLVTQLSGDQIDVVGGLNPNTLSPDISQGYYAGLPGKAFYLKNSDGTHERVFFTEATEIVDDSRIKPGETYQGEFEFNLPDSGTSLQVEVKLLYRRAWRQLIDIKGWTTTGVGEPLADIQGEDFGYRMEYSLNSVDVCQDRDLNQTGTIDPADLGLLLESWWVGTPPFGTEIRVDVRHLLAIVKCYDQP